MATITKQSSTQKNSLVLPLQRNYQEIVEFLDNNWSSAQNITALKQLDTALANPSKNVKAVFVCGTNGKGLTIHFASKLFMEEGIKIGAFYAPHILTYNERFVLNNETISNKVFTEIANEVINAALTNNITVNTHQILTMMAVLYFSQQNVDVALLEMSTDNANDPVNICQPNIVAITRITDEILVPKSQATLDHLTTLLEVVKEGTQVVSADQSKLNLQVILELTQARGGQWSMPIRKLASLPYPFEQLHGRCAALAERICQIFIDKFTQKEATIVADSLLIKQKAQRGRPTLAATKARIENPKKTLSQFWKESVSNLPGHFQLLEKEKPTILLDNASNIDALKNLLLGIRLLHYKRPLKGIAFVFGCDKKLMNVEEFLRALRYFTKKNSGQVILCPINESLPGVDESSWNLDDIVNNSKSLKVKPRVTTSFEEAFELACKSVDERHGLVIISGSQTIIHQYWHHKGIKKI